MSFNHFSFDAENHIYRLGTVVLPSVTQILQDLGLRPTFPPGPYRVRGRNVHTACEFWDQGTLGKYDIGMAIMGYVNAWQAATREWGWIWNPDGIEQRVYDPVNIVAGTIDRCGTFNGKPLILDIKSGAAGKEAALQTAAYALMRFPDNHCEVLRCTVELHGDGTYNAPVWYADWQDFVVWKGAVSLWKWKTKK